MFKRISIIVTIIAVLGGGLYAYQVTTKPDKIHNKLSQTFSDLGFDQAALPTPEKTGRTLSYKNINLDPDGFSTIKTLSVAHSPFILSLSDDDAVATIKGMDLTGELGPEGEITIAGLKPPEKMTLTFATLPSTINIEDFSLSLLSENFGGINITGSLQIKTDRDKLKLQGKIDAIQKQVVINARLEGQINQNEFVDARIEIENGKFDLGHIQATRIAGLILASGENFSNIKTVSELQTGALKVYGLPWQNAAITIDAKNGTPGAIISAKSAGFEGMELGLTIPDIFTPEAFIGQLHTDTLKTAFDYFGSQQTLPFDETTLKNLSSLENIAVKFAKKDSIKFQIRDDAQTASLTGIVKLQDSGFNGEIKSSPIPLLKISDTLAGTLQLSGNFEKQDSLSGKIKVKLDNTQLNFGLIQLGDISADLIINDAITLSGPNTENLKCSITEFKLEERCTLSASIKNGLLNITDLKASGPGFDVFVPQADDQKTLFQIRSIELQELLQLFGNPQWNGSGTLDGNAIVEKAEGRPKLKQLSLTNKNNGVLHITDPAFFALLDMEDLEKETMKLALENFHYDLLKITAEGSFPNKVKIKVFGKGKNPILMQGRPFSLDFEITPDFSNIAKEITQDP